MRRFAAAAEVDDHLDGDLVVVADDREVGDPDARTASRVEERVQRAAGREPRPPVHKADGAVAADGGAEIRRFAVHAEQSH